MHIFCTKQKKNVSFMVHPATESVAVLLIFSLEVGKGG